MSPSRRTVLAVSLVGLLALAAWLLAAVLGTVFFAVTVAYLLAPLHRRVEQVGLSAWWASAATALLASLAALLPVAAGVYLATGRAGQFLEFLQGVPESFTLSGLGYEHVVDVGVVLDAAIAYATPFAVNVARALPELAVKFTLFGVLVFGLLMAHEQAERALLSPVPSDYHDLANALARRARETLYAIYVLQAVTALATAVFAVPVFYLFDVPFPVTLAVVAGILQFVPIVGPSLVILAIAGYLASVGDVAGAATVLVVAGIVVAWLPDVLVRTRLSRETANLPASLYFIGFTGGLLTVGAVGIIAGPLVVALVVECAQLLAAENST